MSPLIAALLALSLTAGPVPSSELIAKAASAYAALDYDDVVKLTAEVLRRDDLPMEQRLEAYRLQGCAKVVVGTAQEAEQAFRLLLRTKLDYLLPPNTPPKIQAAFDKVQRDERTITDSAARYAREKKIAAMKVLDGPPATARGGRPLAFDLRFADPGGDIAMVRVAYRKSTDAAYSTLALQRDVGGVWRGVLPGELSASEGGFRLEYVIETADAIGPLLVSGTAAAPRSVEVSAGSVKRALLPRWVSLTGVGLTVASGATAGLLAWQLSAKTDHYLRLEGEMPGPQLIALKTEGDALAQATTVAWFVAGGLAVVTLALAVFFTDWNP